MGSIANKRIARLRVIAGVLALCVLAIFTLVIWAKSGVMHAEPGAWESALTDPTNIVEQHANDVVLCPAEKATSTGLVF